jgi:hypothetical protein
MLGGFDNLQADRRVGQRDGQIEDDLNVRVGQQLVYRDGLHAVLHGFGLCRLHAQVGNRLHPDQLGPCCPLEVGMADVAAADDADVDSCHGVPKLPSG